MVDLPRIETRPIDIAQAAVREGTASNVGRGTSTRPVSNRVPHASTSRPAQSETGIGYDPRMSERKSFLVHYVLPAILLGIAFGLGVLATR